jgi:hypothetical protein
MPIFDLQNDGLQIFANIERPEYALEFVKINRGLIYSSEGKKMVPILA